MTEWDFTRRPDQPKDFRELLADGHPLPSPYSLIAADMNRERYHRKLAMRWRIRKLQLANS